MNLYFDKIYDELIVEEVIKIVSIFLSVSNIFMIGIMLNISPTLAPCIQIVLSSLFFFARNFEAEDNVNQHQLKHAILLLKMKY